MKRLGEILAAATAALFVILLPPALTLRTLPGTLYDPGWLGEAVNSNLLESGALRAALVRNVIPAAIEEDDNQLLRAMTADLGVEEWRRITELAVPEPWVEEQMAVAFEAFARWLQEDDPVPSIVVNTEPVKRRLIGAGTSEIVEILVASWPPCSSQETAQLESAFRAGGQLPLLICQPPEPYRSVLTGFVADALHREARDLPSQVDVGNRLLSGDLSGWLAFKRVASSLLLLARWGWLVPLSLLGLIMALAVRSWRGWSRWWGWPLTVGGALTALAAVVARGRAAIWAGRLVVEPAVPEAIAGPLRGILLDLLRTALGRTIALGAVALALGAALLVAGGLLPAKSGQIPSGSRPAVRDEEGDTPPGMFG